MKHLRYWSLTALAVLLILLPTRACGPDFPSAVFVLPEAPDGDYAAFAAGHLGVLQPDFHSRSLAIAYRILTGPPLTPAERQQAIAANTHFVAPDFGYTNGQPDPPPPGLTAWIAARASIGPVDNFLPTKDLATDRSLTGNSYEAFPNCLDPALATAAATLTARMQQHGPHDPTVTDWVRGQDAVFSNCGDGKAPQFFGPGTPPPPPPAPHLPAALNNAPLWLQQDRAYQIAAAHFYATGFDTALAGFRAIAADTASPWSTTARYLEARTLIRKATLLPQPVNESSGAPMTDEQRSAHQAAFQQQIEQAADQRAATLQQAQHELLAMQSEARMAALRPAIDGLLDYADARLDPERQTITLAQRILSPGQTRLRQTLIDFTALHTTGADSSSEISLGPTHDTTQLAARQALLAKDSASADASLRAAADMAAWVDDLNGTDDSLRGLPAGSLKPNTPGAPNSANALAHFRANPASTPWLVAALIFAQPGDADTPALLAAARKILPANPAWLTVTYHRLRLGPAGDERRAEVNALLPRLRSTEGVSAVNLFSSLAAAQAPTLADWLAHAGRTPAGESNDEDADVQPMTPPGKQEDICGHPTTSLQLFDTDAAVALNRQMPLRLQADAAESMALPGNLRFQVAQAALTRAILLDKPAIANRMAPVLEACRAAWKPVLDAYAAAATLEARHAAGLFALMRFASTEPSVREGEERRSGFASYDEMRQNWWCSTVPLPTQTVDYAPPQWRPGSDPDAVAGSDPAAMTTHPHTVPSAPAFLTAADLAEAKTEAAALEAIPNASSYFAQQAIAWFHAHPTDPRTPELLGQADRVLRNSCRHDPEYGKQPGPDSTAVYAHTLFDLLHQNFPQSHWALRYKTWE